MIVLQYSSSPNAIYYLRVGFGGKLVHKMRKASSNLIPSSNRSSNPPANSGIDGSTATALPLPSPVVGPNNSSMRGAPGSRLSTRDIVGGAQDSGMAPTGDLHLDDSSSVGSGSLDSGQNSPANEVSVRRIPQLFHLSFLTQFYQNSVKVA